MLEFYRELYCNRSQGAEVFHFVGPFFLQKSPIAKIQFFIQYLVLSHFVRDLFVQIWPLEIPESIYHSKLVLQ